MNKESQQHNFEEVLKKMMQYCSYSERSDFEAKIKVDTFLISTDDKRKVITFLKEENFLNENRFATAFVSGKVRIKRWGRYKISAALRAKRVGQSLIQEAFKEIDEEVYFDNIKHLLKQKKFSASMSDYEKSKIVRYLLSKGYENDLIWEAIKDFNKE